MILLLLVRKSEIVLDSGFDAVDSGFQVPDSGFFDSGTAILDSNPYSLSYTGRNPKQKFPGFRNPDSLACGDFWEEVWGRKPKLGWKKCVT